MKLVEQAARYGLVGAANTAVGLAIIFLCMALGLGDIASNAVGYAVGLGLSYLLNSQWTLGHRGSHAAAVSRFLIVVAIAYVANLSAMLVARDWIGLNSHFAQLVGVAVYVGIGFAGSRLYAFAR